MFEVFPVPVYDVEVVAVVPLADDVVTGGDPPLEHGVEDLAELLRIERAEQ